MLLRTPLVDDNQNWSDLLAPDGTMRRIPGRPDLDQPRVWGCRQLSGRSARRCDRRNQEPAPHLGRIRPCASRDAADQPGGENRHGPTARHRDTAAPDDQARLSCPDDRRQGPLHGQGQGIRIRLLGWRPPLRLWRLPLYRRALGPGGAGPDRYLWLEARRPHPGCRLRQGFPALRAEEEASPGTHRRIRYLQAWARRRHGRNPAASLLLSG